jgi:hypothetical protein
MKRTMQFLFAMSILLEGFSATAGTNPTIEDKPIANTAMVSTVRSPLVLIVTVLDDSYKPIQGARVAAPCTGLAPIYTDVNGNAQFTLPGRCNCDGAQAQVSTSTCNEYISLKCAGPNEAICP